MESYLQYLIDISCNDDDTIDINKQFVNSLSHYGIFHAITQTEMNTFMNVINYFSINIKNRLLFASIDEIIHNNKWWFKTNCKTLQLLVICDRILKLNYLLNKINYERNKPLDFDDLNGIVCGFDTLKIEFATKYTNYIDFVTNNMLWYIHNLDNLNMLFRAYIKGEHFESLLNDCEILY
jgi:hypothetical protein